MKLSYDQDGYWIDPEGKVFEIDGESHPTWAAKHLYGDEIGAGDGWKAFTQLAEDGWRRVVTEQRRGMKTIFVACGNLNRAQRATLEMIAIKDEATLILDPNGYCNLSHPNYNGTVLYAPPEVAESSTRFLIDAIFERRDQAILAVFSQPKL